MNDSKTEIVVFGSPASNIQIKKQLGPLSENSHAYTKNLGVIFDNGLKFDEQINSVVRSSFYHLRSIAKLKAFLTVKDLETVIHAFISSRLDYCNSLYLGVAKSSLSRLQMVQNAAARLLTGTRKREHILPVLFSLHWLPVEYRVKFKVLLYVFKGLYGQAPQYITDLLHRKCSRSLRSSNKLMLTVPRSRLKLKGDRAFSVAAPRLWNDLPEHLRLSSTVDSFKSSLKTYFFSLAFG